MPRGRQRKYETEYHCKLREKVARHRAKHRVELQQRADRKALATGRQPQAKARWLLFERTTLQGDAADVLLVRVGQDAPEGYAAGGCGWLPSSILPFHLARSLAASRRRQLRSWFADHPL